MFTGIVEEVGTVASFEGGGGGRLTVSCHAVLEGTRPGHSVAVDGVCLTVEALEAGSFTCALSPETLERTTLGSARAGRAVNLERALVFGGRVGGHLAAGHVEGQGRILALRPEGRGRILEVAFPSEFAPFVPVKGSVCVDGVSLTVTGVSGRRFKVAMVPETFEKTTFRLKRPGDSVNLEPDLILKYVRWVVEGIHGSAVPAGSAFDTLVKSGTMPDQE